VDEVLVDTLVERETLWLTDDGVLVETIVECETFWLADDDVLEDALAEWETFWLTVDETLGIEDGETLRLAKSLADGSTLFCAKREISKLLFLLIVNLPFYAKCLPALLSLSGCWKSLLVSLKN